MNQREIDALEKCFEQVNAGVPVEECINQSNDLSPEMTEMLKTASDLMKLGDIPVSDEQMKRSLTKFLTTADKLNTEQSSSSTEHQPLTLGTRIRELLRPGVLRKPLFSRMALVLGFTAVLLLLSGGLVITSAKSLPGDSLYPVKLAVEDMTVYLVPIREIRLEYEVNYSQQRVNEVNRLIALHRTQQISFEGVLNKDSSNNWTVSGIPVTIQPVTTFVGVLNIAEPFVNGSVVEVEGITNSEGGVTANEIHLRQYPFTGIVENIDKNSWQISGIKLLITTQSRIGDGIKVGDEVDVLIRSEDDGLYALSITSTNQPASISITKPTLDDHSTVLLDPTERGDIEIHGAIISSEVEDTLESEAPSHEELQAAAQSSVDDEHEGSKTIGTSETHETEYEEQQTHITPEQHESLEQTESPGETP
jgi:hypothetical protein